MRATFFAAVLVASAASVAVAQPGDPGAEERARVLYEKGTKHYDLAEYDEAIASFKDAYKELKEPLFLYNIAQAHRQKRDCVNAVKFYRTYLRGESEGGTADQARAFVTELEACAKEQEKAATSAQNPTVGEGQGQETGDTGRGKGRGRGTIGEIPAVGAVVTVDRGKTKRLVGMVVGGVGVVMFGVGVTQGIKAGNTADELERTCSAADPCTPDEWQTIHDRGNGQQTNQVLGIGAGTIAIAAGVGLYLWGRAGRTERASVSVLHVPHGAGLTAHVRF